MAEDFTDASGDKPISWWYFEEAASPAVDGNTTNANDLTWNAAYSGRVATHKQGSFAYETLQEGTAGQMPGRTHANLSANFPFKAATTAFTIGGWVYFANYLTGATIQTYSNGAQGYVFATDTTTANQVNAGLTSTGQLPSDATLAVGWHHLVLRWNGDNRSGAGANDELSFWVDGAKQTTTQTPASVTLNTGGLGFLIYGYGVEHHIHDEWFVFNVALLDTQIQSIYNYRLDGSLDVSTTGNLAWITA